MDVDAAQYASMSREMLESGNYLKLFDTGIPYLDKPPFLFWISSISIHFFGVNGFGYRFPSFLFGLLAIYSTYKIARKYYGEKTALLAALMLSTAQGFFLMMHDVRTDTMLMGAVAFSIWQLDEWLDTRRLTAFCLGCIGIAVGMMTKGPIALFVPCFALGAQVFAKRDFRVLARWEYFLGIILIALLLFPMSWGLYHFDFFIGHKALGGLQASRRGTTEQRLCFYCKTCFGLFYLGFCFSYRAGFKWLIDL